MLLDKTLHTLAAAIYAQQVDLDQPLFFKEIANRSIQAAHIFLECMTEEDKKIATLALREGCKSIIGTNSCPALERTDKERLEVAKNLALEGQKIQAIKAVRNTLGYRLKESKELVDWWLSEKR